MRVDHGGANVLVTQELLNSSDIVTVFKQVSSKAVTEGVTTPIAMDLRQTNCLLDGALKVIWVKVMPSLLTSSRIPRAFHRGKYILPTQLPPGLRIFSGECEGEPTLPKPSLRSA